MGDKVQPEALSIPEQINNLKNNNLIIEDEDFATTILNQISYYRLIKAYGTTFKNKDGIYNEGVTFNTIYQVYEFDRKLRHLLIPQLQDIEITFRCQISNYFCTKYGVMGYRDARNFDDVCPFSALESKIDQCKDQAKDSPIIKHFNEHYIDGLVPLYAAIEVFTFGTLAMFYRDMKREDRVAIAKLYSRVDEHYLPSWLDSIGYVRNLCFHYNRLYNKTLIKKPILYKREDGNVNNSHLYGVLCCMRYLCNDNNPDGWNAFVYALKDLFNEYSACVKPSRIGCTDDHWYEKLLDQQTSLYKQIHNIRID